MKVIVLIENTSKCSLCAEHGLSVYIEYNGMKYLLDAGGFETPKGLILLNSCSHGGIVNIVKKVQMALGNQKVYSVIGGLHMLH